MYLFEQAYVGETLAKEAKQNQISDMYLADILGISLGIFFGYLSTLVSFTLGPISFN